MGVDHRSSATLALRALFAAIRWVLARFLAPTRGRHRGGVQRGPVPVDAIGLGQRFDMKGTILGDHGRYQEALVALERVLNQAADTSGRVSATPC